MFFAGPCLGRWGLFSPLPNLVLCGAHSHPRSWRARADPDNQSCNWEASNKGRCTWAQTENAFFSRLQLFAQLSILGEPGDKRRNPKKSEENDANRKAKKTKKTNRKCKFLPTQSACKGVGTSQFKGSDHYKVFELCFLTGLKAQLIFKNI